MKMVAAAKLRRSQERIIQMRPFAQKMSSILQNLSSSGSDNDAWYGKVREIQKVLVVVVSSDRGLCGSFNSSVIKATNRHIQENTPDQASQNNVTILPIGKKALEFFKKRKSKLQAKYWNILQDLSYNNVADVDEYII
jgi:F-type H+-transporting ATPase subunit gamma